KYASKYYINNLNTKNGLEALEYLKKRNISKEIIDEFQIGLSLSKSNELTQFLHNKKIEEHNIEKVGLANQGDNGYYDVFRNRIMFPLWDISGNTVGYSGRIYNTQDDAKYVNTKETPIFKKGELLYNYHRAKDEARKEKSVILVEGFMDVIRMYTVGIKNVVALMGTSLTINQINLLKKLSTNIIVCMDGDDAGANATISIVKELEKNDVFAKIVRLDEKLDPDEYILKFGAEKFISRISNPLTSLQYKISYLRLDKDFEDPEDISKYISQVTKVLSRLNDEVTEELIIKDLSEEFKIDFDTIKKQIQPKEEKTKDKEVTNILHKNMNKYLKSERCLAYYMLKSDEVSRMYELNIAYLPSFLVRVLADEIIEYKKNNDEFEIADFMTSIQDKEELVKLLGEILSLDLAEEVNFEEIEDYIKNLKDYIKNNEITKLKQKIDNETDSIEQAKLAEKIRKIKTEE
ncbi:MAG: DNA primase, partial [Fusobacteriaceae bacterium]|nr:DNA primase [Fusobacteriaceae bacterium]